MSGMRVNTHETPEVAKEHMRVNTHEIVKERKSMLQLHRSDLIVTVIL